MPNSSQATFIFSCFRLLTVTALPHGHVTHRSKGLTLWLYERRGDEIIDEIFNKQWDTVFAAFPIREDI